jgi:hypothetical protein
VVKYLLKSAKLHWVQMRKNEVQTSELLQGVKGTWERSLSSGGW